MQKDTLAVSSNIHFINQGIDLLTKMTDKEYALNNGSYFKSGVGKHFRHIIDHYISLLKSDYISVNYDDRERDERIELNRSYAIDVMNDLISDLEDLQDYSVKLDVELNVMSNEGLGEGNTSWSKSSVRRELQFLISHTVHHYALIAIILKTIGFALPDDFGVAPSTLKYEAERSANSTV